ncbi:MAG: GNAT family N-acetyltransferase [Spirochaetaceae bacterium]
MMHGTWRLARENDLPELADFLTAREHACVSFTAQLRRGTALVLPPKLRERVAIFETEQAEIKAAILHASTGFVFPVFTDELTTVPRANARVLMPLRHPPLTFGAVMGRRRDVDLFQSIVSAKSRNDMVYYLMWRPAGISAPPPHHPDVPKVRRATAEDFRALLPLQEAYEREEVLLPGRSLIPRVVEQNLRSALKDQLIILGENSRGPVSKVATNARGLVFDQVGGVFTLPEYRNRGVASHLMRHLIHQVGLEGRATTLFVKKHNEPAVAMYRRLGYRTAGDFRILYYR